MKRSLMLLKHIWKVIYLDLPVDFDYSIVNISATIRDAHSIARPYALDARVDVVPFQLIPSQRQHCRKPVEHQQTNRQRHDEQAQHVADDSPQVSKPAADQDEVQGTLPPWALRGTVHSD